MMLALGHELCYKKPAMRPALLYSTHHAHTLQSIAVLRAFLVAAE
jgi:hypothetical protein